MLVSCCPEGDDGVEALLVLCTRQRAIVLLHCLADIVALAGKVLAQFHQPSVTQEEVRGVRLFLQK